MSVVPYEPNSQRAWIGLLPEAAELAKAIANTEFVPKSLRGNPAAIAAAVLYGDEVGLGPMQSLSRIAVIEGRPTLAAETQRALILQAGHELWVEESTNTKVTVAGRRRDSEQTSRLTWTMDDARRANLAGRPAWKLYPRQMLLARASAELARAVFADAIGGLAATEELEDGDGTQAAVSPEPGTPEKPARKRKRASTNLPAVSAEPEPKPAAAQGPPLPGEEGVVVDVELELEQAKEAAAEESAPISEAQVKKLMALFRDKKVTTREGRLAYCSYVARRDIPSSTDLTMEEASKIIDALEQWDPGDPKSRPFPEMVGW